MLRSGLRQASDLNRCDFARVHRPTALLSSLLRARFHETKGPKTSLVHVFCNAA